MHTSGNDSDSDGMEEEEFYVVSRGDFSGFPRVEATGGEPWTSVPPPEPPLSSPSSSSAPSAPVPGPSEASSHSTSTATAAATSARPNPPRKMSVTQLVSKLDYETPKSPEKRLPVFPPETQAQRASLTRFMHELRRDEDEEQAEREAYFATHGRHKAEHRPPRMNAVDGFVFPDGPSSSASDDGPPTSRDGTTGLMPGSFFDRLGPPTSQHGGRSETWWYGGEQTYEIMMPDEGQADRISEYRRQVQRAIDNGTRPVDERSDMSEESDSKEANPWRVVASQPLTITRSGPGDTPEWFRQHMATQKKTDLQIKEIRRRRIQEQIASRQPINAPAKVNRYMTDRDGNVTGFTEGPGRHFRVIGIPGEGGADGPYRIEEELPPKIDDDHHRAPPGGEGNEPDICDI